MHDKKIKLKSQKDTTKPTIFSRTVYALCAILVLTSVMVSFSEYTQMKLFQQTVANSYDNALHGVAGQVEDMNHLLRKVQVMKYPNQYAPLFAELWGKASSAHESLLTLPYNHRVVLTAAQYLSQVSDFSYAMMMKTINGESLNKEDQENINTIQSYSEQLNIQLGDIVNNINLKGDVHWSELAEEALSNQDTSGLIVPQALLGSLTPVAKQFQNYSGLIYDGPFSDHIQNIKPKMTQDKPKINKDKGTEIVKELIGSTAYTRINFVSETQDDTDGIIPVYSYEVILPDAQLGSLYVDITKYGGYVLWMLHTENIAPTGNFITVETAIKSAEEFLKRNKYPSVIYSYYEISDHSIVINFAPYTKGIIFYSDLIKVKVSLVDGSILGLEALGYVSMHVERDLPKKTMSLAEAQEYISHTLNILQEKKALIPLDSGKEALCYEFKTSDTDGTVFLIYINAENGKMERIFELVENEFGVLAE